MKRWEAAAAAEEVLMESSCDAISGAERGGCTECTSCPAFRIWYSAATGTEPSVMFFCSGCGCDSASHPVSQRWVKEDAARRAVEQAQAEAYRQRARAEEERAARARAAQSGGGPGQRSRHLAVLGLPPSATQQQAASRWKRLALKLHPDKTTGDSAAFVRVADAWRALQEEW